MIAGTVKAFGFPLDYVLYDLSYANLIMYGAVLPTFGRDRSHRQEEEVINADDPGNRDRVRSIIFNGK